MLTVKLRPAAWLAGTPAMPLTLPGRGDSPGVTICRRRNDPGWTMKELLAPLWLGCPWTSARRLTFPLLMFVSSARYVVTLPLHWPEVRVTVDGVIRPSPKLVSSRRRTVPVNPLTSTPLGSLPVTVIENGTPAVWCLAMAETSRLWSTIDRTWELVPSPIVPSD